MGTTLGYLVCDLLLLVMVAVAFFATGWRPGRAWSVLAAGMAVSALADGIYVYQGSTGSYLAGGWPDTMWPLAFVLVAAAAWQPRRPASRAHVGWSVSSVPLVCSTLSIGVLVHAGLGHASRLAVVLAGAALVTGLLRALLMLRENFRLVRSSQREAMIDKLTELPNRRALVEDLDGFKDYNDAFGHPAGDALLRRLAPALAAVGGRRAHRLGGDDDAGHPRRSAAPRTSAGTARGYPDGLAAEEIPLGARIVCVCDAYDADAQPPPLQGADDARRGDRRAAPLRRQPVRPAGRRNLDTVVSGCRYTCDRWTR